MDLSEKAMLIKISFKCWPAAKCDKRVGKEVAKQNNADEEVGRYNKKLLLNAPKYDEIKALHRKIREYFFDHTLPWGDDEARILSGELYFPFNEKMREFAAEHRVAVEQFIDAYSVYVAESKEKLGGLRVDSDYPDLDELREKFDFQFEVKPVPSGGSDFRVRLSADEEQRIRRDLDESQRKALEAGITDMYKRLYAVINHMAEQLGDPDAKIYAATINNLTQLVDLLPRLNVVGDPELAKMADQARKDLLKYSPDALRNSPQMRQETAQNAVKMARSLAGVLDIPAEEVATLKPASSEKKEAPGEETAVLAFDAAPAQEAEIEAKADQIFDHMAGYMAP